MKGALGLIAIFVVGYIIWITAVFIKRTGKKYRENKNEGKKD